MGLPIRSMGRWVNCFIHRRHRRLPDRLSGMAVVVFAAGALLLLSACASQVSTATGAEADQVTLERTWQLHGVEPADGERLDSLEQPYTFSVDADGQASGRAACNRWFANARFPEAGRLRFDGVGSTRALCQVHDAREQAFEHTFAQRMAQGVMAYHLEEGQLVLTLGNGDRWIFEPGR